MNKRLVVDQILRTAFTNMKAIAHLVDKKLETPALALFYLTIDQLSWVSAPMEESGGQEFKSWTDKFFIAGESMAITADDIWAARCGTLHTGAAESRDYRKNNASVIYYYQDNRGTPVADLRREADKVATHLGIPTTRMQLIEFYPFCIRLAPAIQRFEQHLLSLTDLELQPMLDKANRQLSFQSV